MCFIIAEHCHLTVTLQNIARRYSMCLSTNDIINRTGGAPSCRLIGHGRIYLGAYDGPTAVSNGTLSWSLRAQSLHRPSWPATAAE